jgi:hypothetical protein
LTSASLIVLVEPDAAAAAADPADEEIPLEDESSMLPRIAAVI